LYDPETDEGRLYPNMPTNVYDPVWSPDGEWLAFTGVVDGQTDVWVIKEPSGDDTPIRLTNTGAARAAAWSPDARTLAFVGIDEQGANLYALALESGENASLRAGDVQQLTTSGNVDANSRASWAE
jgi:TolB protein